MVQSNNHFAQLAVQVRAGETQVRGQIQRELEPCLLRIVTRALAHDAPALPLHRRIQALTRQLHPAPIKDDDDRRQAAHAVCDWIVNRLAPIDTVTVGCLATLLC